MTIDASIPLQLRPIQIESPIQQAGNVLALQGGIQRNALAGMQMQQMQRQMADEAATREVLSGTQDLNEAANRLLQRGLVNPAMQIRKTDMENRKGQLEIDTKTAALEKGRLELLGGALAPLAARPNVSADELATALANAVMAGFPRDKAEQIANNAPQNVMELGPYVQRLTGLTQHGLEMLKSYMPKVDMTQAGGQVIPTNTNPLAGPIGPMQGTAPIEKTPEIPQGFTKGPDGRLVIDPGFLSGKSQIAAAGRPVTNVTVKEGQRSFENENKLRDDYNASPIVKSANEMQAAFRLIETASKNPSPANDLAMATKYMKILDPNSVVRESELALALNATGVIDRVFNYAQQIANGMKLNPQQRADFYKSAKAINDAMQTERGKVDQQFTELATGYGLNPKNVVTSIRTATPPAERKITRTGTFDGKKVVEYSDGSVEYK